MLQDEFAERLHLCLGATPVADFARQCDISESLLRKYLAGRALPGTDKLVRLAQGSNTSLDWLVSGKGCRKRTGMEVRVHGGEGDEEGDLVYPPHLNAPERALDREPRNITFGFHVGWVRRVLGAEPQDLVLFTVGGDAMEPTVHEGDLVLVDSAVSHHDDDTLYLIRRGEHLAVKRIQRRLNGALLVRNDNDRYEDEQIDATARGEMELVGKVVWTSAVV